MPTVAGSDVVPDSLPNAHSYALRTHSAPFAPDLWRAVEAQHKIATMVLVDTLDEQALLESQLPDGGLNCFPWRALDHSHGAIDPPKPLRVAPARQPRHPTTPYLSRGAVARYSLPNVDKITIAHEPVDHNERPGAPLHGG